MNKIMFIFQAIIRKISPIKKNRVVFTSFAGHYSDSPKNIFNKMYEKNHKLEYIWLVDKKNSANIPKFAKTIEFGTLKAAYYSGSAHILIDNVYGYKYCELKSNSFIAKVVFKIFGWLNTKKNQYLYSTWHGTPLKKIGRDQKNLTVIDNKCKNTIMILGDNHTVKIMKNLLYNRIECKLIGCPRNDILYSDNDNKNEIKEKIDLPLNKKIILFAPTFRSGTGEKNKDIARSGINQINEMNFDLLFSTLNKRFNGDWVLVCRFHYHVANLINWEEIEKKYNGTIINGNKSDDMSEYLACADILVSDLSSCLLDFMVTNRPAFSYFPDYDYYANEERGLYYPLEKLPFPFSKDFEGFISNIQNFDENKYKKRIKEIEKEFGFELSPNATEKVVDYILKDRNLL